MSTIRLIRAIRLRRDECNEEVNVEFGGTERIPETNVRRMDEMKARRRLSGIYAMGALLATLPFAAVAQPR